jgi:cysteine desulfurase / selenocysteine lyase
VTPDWKAIRGEFAALENWTYLNTATFGQMPRRAADAVAAHFARRDRSACADFGSWFDDLDGIRASVGRLVGCEGRDVAFVTNASSALSLLLGGLDWKPGDQVLTLENEFPNHYYYPQLLRFRDVEFVETCWDRFFEAVTPRTRLVAISSVSYITGFRAPLEKIAPFLRERGILFYLDVTQGLGALRLDVRDAGPDMVSADAYKWLLSPNGAAFMYVAPDLRARLQPNVVGWRSHCDWRNFENLHEGAPRFTEDAEKYEGGMLPFAPLYAMGASVEMILSLGPLEVERRVMEMVGRTRDVLRRLGGRLLCDSSPDYESPVIAARFEGVDPSRLVRALRELRVLVSARRGFLRVSPYFYNDDGDLERFEAALADALAG